MDHVQDRIAWHFVIEASVPRRHSSLLPCCKGLTVQSKSGNQAAWRECCASCVGFHATSRRKIVFLGKLVDGVRAKKNRRGDRRSEVWLENCGRAAHQQ